MNIRMVAAESGDTGLSEMVLPYVEGGFGKVLSRKERELFLKSPQLIQASYPKVYSKLTSNRLQMHNHL